jgi:hypothetical protein
MRALIVATAHPTLKKSTFVHRFDRARTLPKHDEGRHWQPNYSGGGWAMGQFSVGDVVTCIPHLIPRTAAPGDYKVTAAMPDRDGDRVYRIKSPLEEHERVVGENLLVRSDGYLPEDVLGRRVRRGAITLPNLRIALRFQADNEPVILSDATVDKP